MNRHLYLHIMYHCCGSDRRNNLRVSVSDWFTESIDARFNVLPSLYFQMCHHAMSMNNDHHFCICFMHMYNQGSTLAMCPLARMHFLGRRASSGHNNSFYAGPRGQWLSDRWQTHVPVFFCWRIACRRAMVWLTVFHSHSYSTMRTSIKTWLTNSIRHVTKLLMPKLSN